MFSTNLGSKIILCISCILSLIKGEKIAHIRKLSNEKETKNIQNHNDNDTRKLYSFNFHHNNDPKTIQYKYFIESTGIKTSGNGWRIWDRMSPLHVDASTCTTPAIFTGVKGTANMEMCVHERDVVSTNIQSKGRFVDCDELVSIWNKMTKTDKRNIFLDIGANIGACTMEMLVSTNAYIIAFEPTPVNLSKLTSTLLRNKSYLDRVAIFPIGLSDVATSSVINSAKGNLGNSVIDVIVKDVEQQQFYDPVTIQLDTLDAIFQTFDRTKYDIPLIKMDVQGYECHVVNGGKNLIGQVGAIKTEFIEKWFLPHGCSEEKLGNLLSGELGFELMRQGPFDVIGYNKNKH